MANSYTKYSFAELLSNIVDNRGKTCPVDEDGLPLIATNCVKNDTLYPVFEKVRYVNQETYKTWFRGHPEPGDIIFVCKGSPGNACWTPDPVNFCIAQDMVAIRANKKLVDPKFLFALLRSPTTQITPMPREAQQSMKHTGERGIKKSHSNLSNNWLSTNFFL
jgi:type I restriction enzyme S subunit